MGTTGGAVGRGLRDQKEVVVDETVCAYKGAVKNVDDARSHSVFMAFDRAGRSGSGGGVDMRLFAVRTM